MAIQQINLAVPGGDTPRSANTKINANFTNPDHAASRLVGTGADQIPLSSQVPSLLGTAATRNVGTGAGNVMEVGAFGLGVAAQRNDSSTLEAFISSFNKKSQFCGSETVGSIGLPNYSAAIYSQASDSFFYITAGAFGDQAKILAGINGQTIYQHTLYTTRNTTRDSNGFLKAASPIVRVFADKIECNDDAQEQNIEYIKNGVGDYLIKNSSGLSNDGWYIETPKDANGNVLVAVVYKQLENGDISIKTYAKRFDEETGDIVPNLARPRDIPDTRWIDLRLNEVEKEPPVMPAQDANADAPAQTNNP